MKKQTFSAIYNSRGVTDMDRFHIIEDESHIREILKSMISILGYRSNCFESADVYAKYMKSPSYQSPTAIPTDNTMPGISGYELIGLIRKVNLHQKIVMITSTPDRIHSSGDELCFTLQKPFRISRLKEVLTALSTCSMEGDKSQYEKKCKFGLNHRCPRSQKRQ